MCEQMFFPAKKILLNACSGGNAVRVITFDLPGGKNGIQNGYLIYKKPYILVTGYAIISNISDDPKKFTVDAAYKHCQTTKTITLSPSINSNGSISYSLSASEKKKYNYLTNGVNIVVDVNINMTK